MNSRITARTLFGSIIFGVLIATSACNKTAPTPPANSARTQTPPTTPPSPPIQMGEKPATLPVTPPAAAPISMKPTDVHPTNAPAIPTATTTATPPKVTPPAGDSKVAVFAGFNAPKPETWTVKPVPEASRQFVLAKYNVPGPEGTEPAEIAVSRAGGTLEGNIERWKGQFKAADGKPAEPTTSTFTADGLSGTLVEFAGAYSGMGGPAKPDQIGLIGVVEVPGEDVFIKLVGPAATVQANRQSFVDMLHGLKHAAPQK